MIDPKVAEEIRSLVAGTARELVTSQGPGPLGLPDGGRALLRAMLAAEWDDKEYDSFREAGASFEDVLEAIWAGIQDVGGRLH